MKSWTALAHFACLGTVCASAIENRATGGYIQKARGAASFTSYSGCGSVACGKTASGYTAAINQLSFGAPPGKGAGDACGRCFSLTGLKDPYSPSFRGPFHTIVVKVTDLCPIAGNQAWCDQRESKPKNQFGKPVHFDICQDTGGAKAFFPSGHGALTGTFKEMPCTEWAGTDGKQLWNGGCLAGKAVQHWPATACGNKGTAP